MKKLTFFVKICFFYETKQKYKATENVKNSVVKLKEVQENYRSDKEIVSEEYWDKWNA